MLMKSLDYNIFLLFSGIPSYWDYQSNLLWSMSKGERQNKFNWLRKNTARLEDGMDNTDLWLSYFGQ